MERAQDIDDILFNIEKKLAEMISIQTESLEVLNFQNRLALHGLEGYKARLMQDERCKDLSGFRESLFERVRNDRELRHPHTKILNHLAGQYDFNRNLFAEVHFSRIVKECRIGKNMAKEYLDLLVGKGLVESRTDGYRVYYKVRGDE